MCWMRCNARGHNIVPTEPHTSANSILVTPGGYVGAADTAHARRAGGGVLNGYDALSAAGGGGTALNVPMQR